MLPRLPVALWSIPLIPLSLLSLLAACGEPAPPCSRTRCGSECVDVLTDPRNCGICGHTCPASNVCSLGGCATTCAAGLTVCGAGCANTVTDPANCGRCGRACEVDTVCSMGQCLVACPMRQTACGGACVTLTSDFANCGACGLACPPAHVCSMGRCALACPDGQTACAGACWQLSTDPAHCGACGTVCPAGHACLKGACTLVCPAPQAACDGRCADLASDLTHCGRCGNACPPANSCTAGTCALACPPGQAPCNGSCATLATDPGHCGACGVACGQGEACVTGKCTLACPQGQVVCGKACVDLDKDATHCGACGKACGLAQVCARGLCAQSCPAPLVACGPSCVDTRSDPDHCGACGVICPAWPNAARVCVAGVCGMGPCSAGWLNCDGLGGNGCEVNGQTDALHCGACGYQCALPGAVNACGGGQCRIGACKAGFGDCDQNQGTGCEANLKTDPAHCGACGAACGAGTWCKGGSCAGWFPDSTLVTSKQGVRINGWIGAPNQAWKLCYLRSRDGASAPAFHALCNNLGATVSVARLSTGVTIGGYSVQSWNNNGAYYGDPGNFLFSLTNDASYPINMANTNYNYGNNTYGPTFGSGHDWYNDATMTGGYCNLGNTYACRVGVYGSSICRNDFCGLYSGWTTTEMEVWVKD